MLTFSEPLGESIRSRYGVRPERLHVVPWGPQLSSPVYIRLATARQPGT